MLPINESVLSLKEKTTQHWFSYLQIARNYLHSFRTDPVNTVFDNFGIMMSRLLDRVQLSIYSTRALFHKNFVAMENRLINNIILRESPSLREVAREKGNCHCRREEPL